MYDETSRLIGFTQVDNNTLKTTGNIDQSLIQFILKGVTAQIWKLL